MLAAALCYVALCCVVLCCGIVGIINSRRLEGGG